MRCAKFAGIGSPALTMPMKVVSTFPTSTTVEKAHVHTGEVLTRKRRKGAHAQGTAVRNLGTLSRARSSCIKCSVREIIVVTKWICSATACAMIA